MKDDVIIRVAGVEDAPRLLAIYAPYVQETAITFEYEVPSEEEFAGRIAAVLQKYPYLMAEQGGQCVGYAYAGPFHSRAAYGWGVETSIYVDKRKKHSGIGGKLHQALESILREQGVLNLNACIAYPAEEDEYLDKNSVEFHRHLGYRLVGENRKCGYKFNRWYHMVWMEKHIGEHVTNQPAVKCFGEIEKLVKERYHIL